MDTEDFTEITELPGSGATEEQVARLYHRYHFAQRYSHNKGVLEVACGAGIGLGYLSKTAKSVVGGDYTSNLLKMAKTHSNGKIPLLQFDAHHLPFISQTFDLIIIFEAIYYLKEADKFIDEAFQLLTPNGLLIIGSVNKEWTEFAPSAFSTSYFSINEICNILKHKGFTTLEFFGAFSTQITSIKHKIISIVRRTVIALNLMPKTLKGRVLFKRLFFGNLKPLPFEISEGMADLDPPEFLKENNFNNEYKIFYCVARRE